MTTTNTYGRQVVIPLTNKSGGSVTAGDVVVVDTGNNDAFTTTTSAGFTGGIGIAQETIADNATGRVLISGYAALVNVNASVTRGNYGKTHTVAKQATGSGARAAGTFCQFLTGGTTPDALVYPVDLAGTALTNPMSAVGDIIQGTTAGAPAALAAPLAGKVLTGAGVTTPLVYSYPPGYEFDYVEITTSTSHTATSAATATTSISSSAVAYDGSTRIKIEFWTAALEAPAGVNASIVINLWDGATDLGRIAQATSPAAAQFRSTGYGVRFLTPTAATHTYLAKGWVTAGTGIVSATSTYLPAFLRITKA